LSLRRRHLFAFFFFFLALLLSSKPKEEKLIPAKKNIASSRIKVEEVKKSTRQIKPQRRKKFPRRFFIIDSTKTGRQEEAGQLHST
jgi:hypothetical protein